MTPTDWGILDFLADGPKPIAELLGRYPKATVYQRLRKLRDEGLVTKSAQGYALTATVSARSPSGTPRSSAKG